MLIKTNGEKINVKRWNPGKTISGKTTEGTKVSYPLSDIDYVLSKKDTLKYTFDETGYPYKVEMENDSVYLVSYTHQVNGMDFEEYCIFNKHHHEILKIKKTIKALETVKTYFGGSCSEFDKLIVQKTPVFKKAIFPYEDWWYVLWYHKHYCETWWKGIND